MRLVNTYKVQAWLILKRLPDTIDREIEHQQSKLVIWIGGLALLFTRIIVGV